MSNPCHILVYRGTTPDFLPVLRELRRRMPGAHITVAAPPSYADDPGAAALADAVLVTERDAYSPRAPGAVLRLVRLLRAQRADRFITLYRTGQQHVLAAASGARQAEAWCWDGRIRPLATSWTGLLLGSVGRALRGTLLRALYWVRAGRLS